MEELLTPQICMDVEDTPLNLNVGQDTTDDETESDHSQLDDDEKVKRLLDLEFSDPSQVPDELTEFEKEAKKNVFGLGEPAVQFQRMHCTSCNVHLGSAPIGYFNRFIHPLLKVVLCKACYDFYCSGEFDKDEDGSEMYCRWCGQGGKVMCCAQCAYVFCQKCVRQNLGRKTLEIIKDSDDWLCFGCNPQQLINLKIICFALYEFTQEEIRVSKQLNNSERLKLDHTLCCTKSKPAKRKRGAEDDESYNPFISDDHKPKRQIKTARVKPAIEYPKLHWNEPKEGEDIVCAPDVSVMMNDEEIPKSRPLPPSGKFTAIAPRPQPVYICSTNNSTPSPSMVRFQTPAIKLISPAQRSITTPIVNSIPALLAPGLKHEWFEKAATVVSTITGNLSQTLDTLTRKSKDSKTVGDLAMVHNKLQELLSTSVNSLIQVRKSLRDEFLSDLKKLKFADGKKTQPKEKNDDDDVIIVNSEPAPTPKRPINGSNRPYLKVRSVSQLLTVPAECITIPDDPPSDDEKPQVVKEKSEEVLVEKSEEVLEETQEKSEEILEETQGKSEEILEETQEKSEEILDETQEKSEENPEKTEENKSEEGPKDDTPKPEEEPDMSECDEETHLMIKNALVESKIDQMVQENRKYATDLPEDEVPKALAVRVYLSTKLSPVLPKNRLKNAEWFTEDIEDFLTCARVPNPLDKSGESSEKIDSEVDDSESEVKNSDDDKDDSDGEEKSDSDKGESKDNISDDEKDESSSSEDSRKEASEGNDLNDGETVGSSKMDVLNSEPVTTDSGIEVDGK